MTEPILLRVAPERTESWTRALTLAGLRVLDDNVNERAALGVTDGSAELPPECAHILEVKDAKETSPERVIALVCRRLEAIHGKRLAAGIDPATGLPGRNQLFSRVENEVELSARIMKPFAVGILDPDGLDALAAGLGDEAAERAMAEFGSYVRERLRRVDGVGRWGREEIGIVMPATYPTQAMTVISRLQDNLAAASDAPGHVRSFTAAVAAYPIDADSASRLMELAESRLADAKRKGDGRIVMV